MRLTVYGYKPPRSERTSFACHIDHDGGWTIHGRSSASTQDGAAIDGILAGLEMAVIFGALDGRLEIEADVQSVLSVLGGLFRWADIEHPCEVRVERSTRPQKWVNTHPKLADIEQIVIAARAEGMRLTLRYVSKYEAPGTAPIHRVTALAKEALTFPRTGGIQQRFEP